MTGARILKLTAGGAAVVIAGTGIPGFSGDDGPAIFAALNQPSAIVVDSGHNLFIADNGNNRIRKVSADGKISSLNVPLLQRIGGLAVDTGGNLYFAETTAHRVRKLSPDGQVSIVAGTGIPGPRGDGGPATSAQLSSPTGLTVAGGNLYVADSGNHRVRKITANGTIVLLAGNGSQGFSGDGAPAVFAQLGNPTMLAADSAGSVYVSGPTDHRIRKILTNGTITTIAGTGENGVEGDGGPATRANLGAVAGLSVGPNGHVYVSDSSSRRVRSIASADGVISVISEISAPETVTAPESK
jgi:hypothetical protein